MSGPPSVQLKFGQKEQSATPTRFQNVIANINSLLVLNDDVSFVKLAKRIIKRLTHKQNSIFKRIESRTARCEENNISEVSRAKQMPIRNACDLIEHYFTDIKTEVNSFFARCPQTDNFGSKSRYALNRLDQRLTRKFNC